MLLDLYTDILGVRSDGLEFPSLEEFSTICCDPHKGFGTVKKAEVDDFLQLSCFFDDPTDVGNLISGSFAFSVWPIRTGVCLEISDFIGVGCGLDIGILKCFLGNSHV